VIDDPGPTGSDSACAERRRLWRRPATAEIVGAIGALVVLASALVGWAGTSGGLAGRGDPRAPSGVVESVRAFTLVPLVAAVVPLWSFGRRVRGGRALPGWALVVTGGLILLVLALGGVHMVSEAAGHRAPAVYAVPRRPVAAAALGASAIVIAGLAGLFTASPAPAGGHG